MVKMDEFLFTRHSVVLSSFTISFFLLRQWPAAKGGSLVRRPVESVNPGHRSLRCEQRPREKGTQRMGSARCWFSSLSGQKSRSQVGQEGPLLVGLEGGGDGRLGPVTVFSTPTRKMFTISVSFYRKKMSEEPNAPVFVITDWPTNPSPPPLRPPPIPISLFLFL